MVAMNSEFGSLLPRTPMESDEGQDSFRGVYPEHGAIFMSSSAMKDECFKRGLFGLPSSQGQFVKQVKTGMILFLFEYERRELHGVFQACSDGEMNILPSAYNSSGKQFPAQVKVKPIWRCHALAEPEFSGAIKDNYFSNWKFHFGLSKAQVRRLLMLFSSRKLVYQPWQRELASKREPISVDTAGRVKEVDDGRSVLSDSVNNELDADNHNGPAMTQSPGNVYENNGKEDGGMLASDKVGDLHKVDKKVGEIMQSEYLGPIPGEVGKLHAAFAKSERAGNKFNVDVESMSSEHPMSGQSGRGDNNLVIHDDSSRLMGNQLQIGSSEGNVFGPVGPTENPAFFQSSLDRPVCRGMPVEETGSLIQDQTKSTSTVGLQITSHSCSASPSYRDAIVPATLPYDPDALSLNNSLSPSIGVNKCSNSVQDCYKQHGIPSITNQSYTGSKGISQSLESTSKFDVHVPIASPDHYEHSCQGNIMHFPEVAYSEEMTVDSSGKQCSREPVLKNSLSTESLSQIGSSERETKSPSSYSLSPSNCLSFVIDRAHHVALQEKLEQAMAQKLNDEPCTAYVTSSDELQCQLQCSVHPDDHSSVDHRDQKSYDHDLKSYACSEGMCSDLKNQRSVFSCLTSDTPGKENSTHADYEETDNDASVDEVMAMLSASNYSWVKSKKSKRPTRLHDDEKFRSNKKTKVDSELDGNDLESNMASATRVEDKVDQRREEIPFVDFKRRSELRKRNGDTNARAKDEIAGKYRLLGGQCKRRKLIRPKFNDNEQRDEKSINGNISLNLQASSQESSVSEDVNGKRRKLVRPKFRVNEPCDDKSMNGNTSKILQVSFQICSTSEESGSCEASIGSQGMLLPQGTDLSLVVCQSSHENANNQTGRSSKYEREIEVESSAASVNFGDEGRKEPLCDVGSQIADLAIPKLLLQCTESSQVVHEDLKELLLDVGSQIVNLAIPKLLPQCKESPQVVHQTSRDNENIEMERFPEYEQDIKTEISGPSLKVGDEGGMEPLHDLDSLAIPYGDKKSNVQKDSDYKVPIVNKSSPDCNDSRHITVQKSALRLPEANSGTENAFYAMECAKGNELELLPIVEPCAESGDLSISNVIGSSRNLNSELQRGAKEVAICVDAGVGDNHPESSNKQSEASLDTMGCLDKQEPSQEHRSGKLSEASFGTVGCFTKPESSLEFRDLNMGFGERLFILSNSFKSSDVNASKHVGERRDALQISSSSVCNSSDIRTCENVEDTISKDLVPSRKCELKAANNHSDINSSKHVGDAQDSFPISGSNVCKSIGTSGNVEERKDVLASSGGIRKRVLKRAINRSKFDTSKHVEDVKDVHPISDSNVDKSLGTSENMEERKVVFPSRVIIRKRVLKIADSGSKIDTSKHLDNAKDFLPISGSNSCKSSDSATSESVEEKKDVLKSNVEIRKGELKKACNKDSLAHDFEFGDDSETDDSKRENKSLWSILTAKLKQLKAAQQTTVTRF
ncbi:hypothetical protein D8674_002683 [Pyrus ussuriensis x Pyrus communis]|uniref:DCD domain-containing protein n=1 Tax=Pyrus ussuriensis x Pyrus communis TaxID=2448454 RepID=A0A5N5FEZ4_9ROSA|nr:hypothetical protein D8674_002683 [Pyrus ussuriensis x Pyrus communis]